MNIQKFDEKKQISLLLVLVTLLLLFLGMGAEQYFSLLQEFDRSLSRSNAAKRRKVRFRTTWEQEQRRLSSRMFYRLFRMEKDCFARLCSLIEEAVGERQFKSEKYITHLRTLGCSTPESRMYRAHLCGNGDYIPGEVKLALTVRILAGATYLDMFLWFNINPDHAISIFRQVTQQWICNDKVIEIDFYKNVLLDEKNRKKITEKFAEKSNGVMSGIIGALDGWLVRIKCPALWEATNAGKYYCRKGFNAINVQVIVDRDKKVLWRHIGARGSSHDSPTFHKSRLGQLLQRWAKELNRKGLYIIGDSAYALRSYLMTPYDNVKPNTKEDHYNYFHSSSRIYVECAFGEIDRRWGILWKPLEGSLYCHQYTIDSCLRLHNHIVDYRMEMKKNNVTIQKENDELDVEGRHFYIHNPFKTPGVVSEDHFKFHCRPTRMEAEE